MEELGTPGGRRPASEAEALEPAERFDPEGADPDPLERFRRWWEEARRVAPDSADAMALATADARARPSARMVILRGFDERGFVFFTNYESPKAADLAANPRAALVWYWPQLRRQVRVTGRVERLPREESEAYFRTRPVGHRLAAWASPQSRVIPSRDALERAYEEARARFPGEDVLLPPFWGGYRVVPEVVEFWQGRENRLHDRVRYRRRDCGWVVERLAP
ncbi:MAG TPA: pyridoxamine 5'-phosphate oxidase [Actinomycetota bacterium]|nr:pyridoxamine 5'-phosphate oxidase [Actinomycetota bacterium]